MNDELDIVVVDVVGCGGASIAAMLKTRSIIIKNVLLIDIESNYNKSLTEK